ncbi:hypothetical protein ROSMUCSMR3_03538 [Roseovarius mucosus]|uniref:Uncharacterized protein n=2 Tax=Roseovarius mucosus TaxID=215743 RepID=A0A1V0RTQ0_9RHOB|nr:hypothetical protein ROSMUCSMR3_03538 [Roseovarius mucosus]
MRSDLENALIPVLQIKDELYSRVPFFQEKWAGDHGDYIPRFVEYYPSPFGFERQFIENILTRKNFHYEIMKLRSTTNLPLKLEALMFELEDAAKFNPYTFFPGTTSALYDNATWKESVELEKLDKPEITVESIEVDGVEYQYYSDPASECYQSVFACFHEIDIALNNLLKELLIEKKTINAALTEVDNELTEESRKRVSDLRQKAKKKGRDFRF